MSNSLITKNGMGILTDPSLFAPPQQLVVTTVAPNSHTPQSFCSSMLHLWLFRNSFKKVSVELNSCSPPVIGCFKKDRSKSFGRCLAA